MKLADLLKKTNRTPWRLNGHEIETVDGALLLTACYGDGDLWPDAMLATHAANVLPELVGAFGSLLKNCDTEDVPAAVLQRAHDALARAEEVQNP